MKPPKLVIEVRPRLQSCQLYYRVNDCADCEEFSLDIQQSSIVVKCNVWEETFVFENLKLKPVSITGLKRDEENVITCRLQTLISINEDGSKMFSPKYVPDLRSDMAVQISCRFCQSNLLKKESYFKRILPLPSSDLNVGDFFCHLHFDNGLEIQNCIEPKLSDLLYGNYFFKTNHKLFCESKFFTINDVLFCQQCRTWIGTKENLSIKLWNCTVCFDSQTESSVSPKEDFISMVTSSVDEGLENMCKIIVTHKVTSLQSTEYLLLWIMDKNLTVFISCEDSNKLVKKSALKLLFSLEKNHSSLVFHWKKDSNIHNLDVAEVMFTEGLNCLEETNKLFPRMFRIANNMSFGYLFRKLF